MSRRRSDPLGPDEPRGVNVPPADELPPKYARYGIAKQTVYETPDGEQHATFAAAVSHVNDNELRTWLYVWFARMAETFVLTSGPKLSENDQAVIVQELVGSLRRDWLITKRKFTEGNKDA